MSSELIVKTGSSGKFFMTCTDDAGAALDISAFVIDIDFINPLTGVTIISTSIGSGITVTNPLIGEYTVDAGATDAWPICTMPVDIKYTNATGDEQHTRTFFLDIQQGLSQ